MVMIFVGLLGLFAFGLGVVFFGSRLKKFPTKDNAENFSRIMHFLFFTGLVAPGLVSIFYPGLMHFDELIGINSLPLKSFFRVVGIILTLPGLYFMVVSNQLLRKLGSGANAFRLTRQIVKANIYQYTRNPMSLGYYLCSLSLSFVTDSKTLTIVVILGLIPVHVFFLKYFEERELELRFGEAYKQYKKKGSFLIPRRLKG